MRGIAVLDAGGQYCHLLARRVRQTHVLSHVLPVDVAAAALKDVSGIIISGGPRSVSEPNAPRIDPSILELGIPILGICYGHQLLASMLPGGLVKRSHASEYGVASLRLASSSTSSILSNVETPSLVWMSHGDSVESVPDGFETLASTDECSVAAMANPKKRIFGVQFHPEVSHTEHGQQILENFVRRVCGVEDSWRPDSLVTIQGLKSEIAAAVGPARKVLFFVSGGVDSSVAYKLCADAVGEDRLRGIYINTGFMRKNESAEVMEAYRRAGFSNIEMVDASERFYAAVGHETDPEKKRKAIGSTFLGEESRALAQLPPADWMLGQGTIYPDTIESGGTTHAAHIKTHHNRVPEVLERIAAGGVVEPLLQFYKDEVREIGRTLGLPPTLVEKQPFPGPGLAVRYLCSEVDATWREDPQLREIAASFGFGARELPIRAVGVQGDARTYSHVAVIDGPYDCSNVTNVSRAITNRVSGVNRVAYWVAGRGDLREHAVYEASITAEGLALLRDADAIVREELPRTTRADQIWQCPVVLLPLRHRGLASVAMRPVESHDGMTAQYSRLSLDDLERIANRLLTLPGLDAVLYDVTNKPPATIEWE
jgi:GMP synthase (glutamine-hydrolysing)